MTNTVDSESASVSLYQAYVEQLRDHAVMLIWLGYHRLDAASLATADEDDITGELVREMRQVAQDSSSPDWVDHYEIREQIRQNVGGKRGKGRPIVDIEIERHDRGPRPCLGFEAKPLGRGKALGAYLNEKGLAAFLSGYYPTTNGEAGMLGYVQEKNCDHWSAKLAREFSHHVVKYRIAGDGELETFTVADEMPALRSRHTDVHGKPLLVIHVMLAFLG